MICGEKTTTQQAIDIELSLCQILNSRLGIDMGHEEGTYPQIPLMAVMSKLRFWDGGTMIGFDVDFEDLELGEWEFPARDHPANF